MKPGDGLLVDWEVTVDQKTGFNSMRTTRRRYITLKLWHVWLILLVASWSGVFSLIWLGLKLAEWLK